jgi:type I restriction enzyme M protein
MAFKIPFSEGLYVDTEAEEDDGIPFDDKMNALTTKLTDRFTRGRGLETQIRENLQGSAMSFNANMLENQ